MSSVLKGSIVGETLNSGFPDHVIESHGCRYPREVPSINTGLREDNSTVTNGQASDSKNDL